MTRSRIFFLLARFSVNHPRLVLLIAVLASVLSIASASQFMKVRTSNLDLIDQELPPIKAFLNFAHEFGTPNVLVVVLEGSNPDALEQTVKKLEPSLRHVSGVRSVVGRIPLDDEVLIRAGVYPYLTSHERDMFMIYVQPEDTRSQAETISPLLDGVRAVLQNANLEADGIKAGLTGIPQYAIDDRDVIQQDISKLSLVSFVLIGIIFVGAFAAFRRPLAAMLVLGFSVAIILGIISIYPGHLTLLSAFFASILFGLGIDYGIHIINRVEEFMDGGMSEAEAIPLSISVLAPELTTGAITTAAAFFAMMATRFLGFQELGLIAGVGVLICLFLMATLLPALLTLVPHRQNRTITARRSRIGRVLILLQHPAVFVLSGMACLTFCFMGGPGFDGNYMNLQPEHSEAVRLERALVEKSNLSPQFAVFTVEDKAKAVDLADRLLDEDSVSEVRSIADLEFLAPVDGASNAWPDSFLKGFVGNSGRYAVYAYPRENVWNPAEQEAFVAAMQKYDPQVTGMPVLGKFMTEQSNQALLVAGLLGGVLLFLCVLINFRSLAPTVLAVTPTFLTVAAMHGIMKWLSIPFNPINIMALPVILGIAVDDGVHIVHRFISEKGDIPRTLSGSGRSVVLTSLTTMAAFGSLAFTRHQGLASFSVVLVMGVSVALILSVTILPRLLTLFQNRLIKNAS